jgi:CheY-like chemotaxis protein
VSRPPDQNPNKDGFTAGAMGRRIRSQWCGEEAAIARVLVVDDDRIVAEMYRLALTRAGHQVEVANDGVAALKAVLANGPDIVFLDIRMPNMDGVEVLRNLSSVKSTSSIPVVMLSNYDEPDLVRQSLSLGAKEYLVKAGTNPTDLDRVVTHWVKLA